eukprot:scaffold289_cov39-Tisochrysis_lutea.AAC.1
MDASHLDRASVPCRSRSTTPWEFSTYPTSRLLVEIMLCVRLYCPIPALPMHPLVDEGLPVAPVLVISNADLDILSTKKLESIGGYLMVRIAA